MNTPVDIADRKRLEKKLAVMRSLYKAYQDVVALDEPMAAKLVQKLLGGVGVVLTEIKRAEAAIAKMEAGKGSK